MKWFLPFPNSKHILSLWCRISLRAAPLTKITWLSSEHSYNNIIKPHTQKTFQRKNSPQNKRGNSQTRDCLQNLQSTRNIYTVIFKNYSWQVKHTFWQLWSLWYVSVHWNAGTESQTGLHHVLLEEWEHCAKYRKKKKWKRNSRF